MKYIRPLSTVILLSSLFLYNGCTSSKKAPVSEGGYYHSDIYFGKNFSDHFKQGIKDGCTTAKGDYKKSHWLFNNNNDYNTGWFLGRNRCKHLLIIEEDEE